MPKGDHYVVTGLVETLDRRRQWPVNTDAPSCLSILFDPNLAVGNSTFLLTP